MKIVKVSKGICNSTKYTFSDKVYSLHRLRENNYNCKLTSEELKIARSTLSNWNNNMGRVIFSLLDNNSNRPELIDESMVNRIINYSSTIEEDIVISEEHFNQLVYKATCTALKRMKKLLKTEDDIITITKVAKVLISILPKKTLKQEYDLRDKDFYVQKLIDKYLIN